MDWIIDGSLLIFKNNKALLNISHVNTNMKNTLSAHDSTV